MNQAVINQTELIALYIGLFVMMIGVSLEVTKADWKQCLQHPVIFFSAIVLQIIGVPFAGMIFVAIFPIHPEVVIGILLIALCPGGVMSNFFSLRAGGNVALSSSLTLLSSLLVPLTFPTGLLIMSHWHTGLVPAGETQHLIQIGYLTALLTIPSFLLGALLNKYRRSLAQRLIAPLKSFSFCLVGLVILTALYSNRSLLITEFWNVFPAAILFNGLLLLFGYVYAAALKLPNNLRRTLSIELGIQNATVALILIPHLYPHQAGVFNMVAFWGVWHLISGLLISAYWSKALKPATA